MEEKSNEMKYNKIVFGMAMVIGALWGLLALFMSGSLVWTVIIGLAAFLVSEAIFGMVRTS